MKAKYYFDQSGVETERVIRELPGGITNKCDIDARLAWYADELLRELINRVHADEHDAAEAGQTETPWLDSARKVIKEAMGE